MIDAVDTAIQAMGDDDARTCTRPELRERFAQLRHLKGATAAYEADLLQATNLLGDGGLDGAGLARTEGGMSSRAAGAAVRTAEALEEMPAAHDALAAGRITAEHAATLARAAGATDPARAEAALVDQADGVPADVFATRSARWVNQQRSNEDAEARLARQRGDRAASRWTDDDGMDVWRLALDPITAASAKSALDERYEALWRADGGRDGSPSEVRTAAQRMADAFVELLTTGRGEAPPAPRHQVTVVVDADRLLGDDPARAELLDGQPLPQSVLDRLACDAIFTLMLVDSGGRPLWLGRDHRLASVAQWKALIARDRGCIGCGAAPDRCQAHHIVEWEDFGPTDIDNLVLLCSRCHHDVHDRGATVVYTDDGHRLRYPGRGDPLWLSREERAPPIDQLGPAA